MMGKLAAVEKKGRNDLVRPFQLFRSRSYIFYRLYFWNFDINSIFKILLQALESEFERNKYLSVSKRMQLSKQLKLTETQVHQINPKVRFFFSFQTNSLFTM